jgi:TetR/AcrR family transcriptional regulator, cholesterol catabolism regulator
VENVEEKPNAESDAAMRILKGARRHFLTHGFRGVTMDDLAGELGMSKKTLYAHFQSKTALLESVLADKFGEINAELNAITSDGDFQFPERLHALLSCVRKHTDEVQPPFMRDMSREAPGLFEKIRANRRALIHRHFGSVLREGKEAGMIRNDVPEKLMIEFLIGAADAVVNPQKLTELGLTARAAFTEIIILFLEGAMTEHGRMKL